jgi:4-hydroxy-2-oxoheptanedioate aldolase
MKQNSVGLLLERSRQGPVLGLWQQIPTPMLSRFLAQLGWDWIILDGQHGSFNYETIYECVHTIRAAGTTPLVRITIANCSELERMLDLGALGLVVPMVNSREEAERLAQAAKYPPLGSRSLGGDVRLHYGEDYPERANRETLLLVQIEHVKAVEAAEAMLSLPGVDGCFVGPTDLAISMGISRFKYEENPSYRQAIKHTLEVCRRHNKLACCNAYSLSDFADKRSLGFQCITLKSDVDLVWGAGKKLLADLRSPSTS